MEPDLRGKENCAAMEEMALSRPYESWCVNQSTPVGRVSKGGEKRVGVSPKCDHGQSWQQQLEGWPTYDLRTKPVARQHSSQKDG